MTPFRWIIFICVGAMSVVSSVSASGAYAAEPSTFVVEEVIWTNIVNATATGNSLEKTAGPFS